MLVELLDGGIKEINYDTESWGGCETCDYGSSYINEFTVYLTKGVLRVKVSKMYDFALSEGYLMTTFLQNVDLIGTCTEEIFAQWLEETINKDLKDKCRYDDLKVEVTFTNN